MCFMSDTQGKVHSMIKAYNSLQRETPRVGGSCWTISPTRDFCAANTNMLVSKNPHGPNANPTGPN